MFEIAITRMSSKGQIVVPKNIREGLGLKPGEVFALIGEGDTLVLKRIELPSNDEFRVLLDWGNEFARKAGITRDDVENAIAETRRSES